MSHQNPESHPPEACEPEPVDRSDPNRWPQASPTMLGVVAERKPLSALTPPAPPSQRGSRRSLTPDVDPNDAKALEAKIERTYRLP